MTQKNNLPPFAEEQILPKEQLKLQEILDKFQQVVPSNFVQLVSKERNYMCSTTGWKNPSCERYIFFQQGQPIQIDIPHTLMEKLKLKKDESIPYSVYLAPSVLTKELSFGALNIEHEHEIFLQQPLTIHNLEKELNKWLEEIKTSENKLSNYKLNLLTSLVKNAHKSQQIIDWKIKAILLGAKLFTKDQELTNKATEITTLQTNLDNLNTQITNLTTEKNHLQTNLTTSKETNTNLNTQINNLTNQITNLNKEKAELTTQLVNLTTEKNNLTDQVTTLLLRPTPEQLTQVQNRLNQLENERTILNQQLITANNTITNLQNQLNTLDSSYTSVNNLLEQEQAKSKCFFLYKEWFMNTLEKKLETYLSLVSKNFTARETKENIEGLSRMVLEITKLHDEFPF